MLPYRIAFSCYIHIVVAFSFGPIHTMDADVLDVPETLHLLTEKHCDGESSAPCM